MDYIGLWKFVAVESRDDNGEKIDTAVVAKFEKM